MQLILSFVVCVLLAGCVASPRFTSEKFDKSEQLSGEFVSEGVASYYADEYHGRKTSNGETYDMNDLTAAHQQLPFNTKVKVTNLDNGKSVLVRINDRGPFKSNRIIDLSYAAAKEINMIGPGTARVRLEIIELGK
ncbi:MAG: septal ring lytic transglycosylase RlpA family protein [Ignavibacteriales bacterium]|nr:septal ring lytic transglycosylase RlpA family protein [Ignavibacteriales bacterium]